MSTFTTYIIGWCLGYIVGVLSMCLLVLIEKWFKDEKRIH